MRSPGLPIPDDWNGSDWTRFSICWPDSRAWRSILFGYLTYPSLGRTWDGGTGVVVDVQQIGREIVNANIDWRYAAVTTCDDGTVLAGAIRYLADRLYDKTCCGAPGAPGGAGSGGAGGGVSSPSDIDTEGQVPPPGFETWAEYQVYICNVMSWLFGQVLGDLNALLIANVSALGVVTLMGPWLVTTLLTPIPGDELFLLAGVLVALIVQSKFTTVVSACIDALEAMQEQAICAAITASDAVAARAGVMAVLQAYLDANYNGVDAYLAGQLLGYFWGYDVLNRLFVKDDTRVYPDADCGSCGGSECVSTWHLTPDNLGASLSQSGDDQQTVYVVSSVAFPGYGPYFVALASLDGCGANLSWELEGGTWTPVSGEFGYTIDGLGGLLMINATYGQADNRQVIAGRSETPFSLRVTATPYNP